MSDDFDYDRLAEALDKRERSKGQSFDRLDGARVSELAKQAAEQAIAVAVPIAVTQTLISFGLDPTDRINLQRDFIFIRDMRTLSGESKKHVLFAVLAALSLGVVSAVWLYLKSTGKSP